MNPVPFTGIMHRLQCIQHLCSMFAQIQHAIKLFVRIWSILVRTKILTNMLLRSSLKHVSCIWQRRIFPSRNSSSSRITVWASTRVSSSSTGCQNWSSHVRTTSMLQSMAKDPQIEPEEHSRKKCEIMWKRKASFFPQKTLKIIAEEITTTKWSAVMKTMMKEMTVMIRAKVHTLWLKWSITLTFQDHQQWKNYI